MIFWRQFIAIIWKGNYIMKNNKKMWIGIGCGILAVALIVGIILMAGGNSNKTSNPTTPSTSATTPSGNVTEPSGTEPNGTEPEVPTLPEDPTVPEEPTPPIIDEPTGPVAPDDPVIEPTIPDDDPTLPTEPDGDPIYPTDPDTGEVIPVDPTTRPNVTPDKDEEYDFGGVTPGTIRASDWNSWDRDKRQAWLDSIDWNSLTPEENHNYLIATRYNDYDCGFEGHACRSEYYHECLMEYINAGCEHCGKHDCPSLLVPDPVTLFTWPDSSYCPEYDITKDPLEYCQHCGLPNHGEPGTICVIYQNDGTCYACGEWIKAWTCHCCDPDDLD